ncbi:hypothetical protein PHMEG_00024059 [Phytophthora megakarya]|uniref:Uncharacterized protein n=1 Tax=Phytophthora megakarya TaxID=4795 RepID=A0A225VGK1_9STRA|nr:hypothetical protein PHMEG_00024059 [Phytophthora megakarya]
MRNVTGWSSTFSKAQRYDKICGALLTLDHDTVAKYGIPGFLLTPEETEAAHTLLKSLHELNEVSKAPQDSTLPLVGARRAFDAVLRKYPSMKIQLASDASIVITPLLRASFLASAFKKNPVAHTPSQYVPQDWVPPTSNEREQYFSQAKLVLTDLRKPMDPNNLEVLMFLSYNKDWWNTFSVRAVRQTTNVYATNDEDDLEGSVCDPFDLKGSVYDPIDLEGSVYDPIDLTEDSNSEENPIDLTY